MNERRILNLIEQLRLKSGELSVVNQELADCRRALAHCRTSNRPLPCPPCPTRPSRQFQSLGRGDPRGMSPPLSEMDYEVPRTAQTEAASPVHFTTYPAVFNARADSIRRRRNTPSVNAKAQTYGPTPRSHTRRTRRQTLV